MDDNLELVRLMPDRRALWDRFASAALAGICANEQACVSSPYDTAQFAASIADSMLKQRDSRFGK
jgi:hypothetical protein